MTNMKSKVINYIFLFFSYLALGVGYSLNAGNNFLENINNRFFVSPESSLLSAFILFCLFLFTKNNNVFVRKFWPFWCFGIAASVIYVLTQSFSINGSANFSGKLNVLITTIAIVGFAYVFTSLGVYLSNLLDSLKIKQWHVKYWHIVSILLIFWIVQIFPLFPGMVSWDGYRQFLEFFHTHIASLNFTYYPTNHHPWAATLVLGMIFSFGKYLGGTNFGLFSIVIVQLVASSLIYAKIIQFVGEKWGKLPSIVALVFYASPFVAFWQVNIEKTPLFLAFTSWFVFCFVKILLSDGKEEASNLLIINLIISAILMSMFRNDGAYVVILSLFVLFILKIIQNKTFSYKYLAILCTFLLVDVGWNKVALPMMNVVPGSTGETITMPMRQLSKVVINDPDSLSEKDLKIVNRITPVKELSSHFNVNNADDLKSLYPVDSFLRSPYEIKQIQDGQLKKEATPRIKNETNQYLKIWFIQFFKHPKEYINVFLTGNSQFLNPILDSDSGSRGIMYGNDYMKNNTFLQPEWYHQVHYWFSDNSRKNISWPNVIFKLPIIRTILQPGFVLWLILFSFSYFIYKRSYLVVICIPVGLLAFVALLSPVNGYERYMLPAMLVAPLLLTVLVNVSLKKIE
ncbi:hypothetical protein FEFB_10140 [Fructobacillus sp. EFB-N1]|uniref:DUF6020 family protein n=1 Tax=Fructobacillus sp. EFB-N1 TaxID=1658766 RepID=UPI00064DE448|nr:DUF6020 family protein [Fructobacillus sp. EFB-N1]KMK53274.1 hypothetical protein FEFB_10140 [Fructobacillus sp. EFB-N1]